MGYLKLSPERKNEYLSLVRSVLLSPEATKINFTAFGVKITGGALLAIGVELPLSTGRSIEISDGNSGGASGSYYSDSNVIELGADYYSDPIDWGAIVVHESIHAWFDRNKMNPPALDNEAIAYIAECIYILNSGVQAERYSRDGIRSVGLRIASTLIAGRSADNRSLLALRALIATNPTYFGKLPATYQADG